MRERDRQTETDRQREKTRKWKTKERKKQIDREGTKKEQVKDNFVPSKMEIKKSQPAGDGMRDWYDGRTMGRGLGGSYLAIFVKSWPALQHKHS